MEPFLVRQVLEFFRKKRDSLLFLLFCPTHALLAYGSLPLEAKLWAGFFLFILPFGWAATRAWQENPHPAGLGGPPSPPFPPWAWGLVLTAALAPRLFGLLAPAWPTPDEAVFSLLAAELSGDWAWTPFFTPAQVPPFFTWMSALFLKLLPPTIFSLRLLLFLLSLLSLGLAFLATRSLLRGTPAFLAFSFFALGFWPLLTFKLTLFMGLTTILQLLALWLWGRNLSSRFASPLENIAWGAVLGLGFWCSIPWLLVPLSLLLAWRTGAPPWSARIRSLLPFGLLTSAFTVWFVLGKGWTHILWLLSHEPSANGFGRLRSLLSNATTLLWEGFPESSLGASWGGLLNPLEGSFLCLGLLKLLRHRKDPVARWLLGASFLFLLPGLLTSGFETFHNILFLPLVPVICAFGASGVLREWGGFPGRTALLSLLAGCILLNCFHLVKSYPTGEPPSSQKAFQILDGFRKDQGPGHMLWSLSPDGGDPGLSFATYAFNVDHNRRLQGFPARWAAVRINSNYRYFLDQSFPGAQWFPLGPDPFWHQGDLLLGIWLREQTPAFPSWFEANRAWQGLGRRLLLEPLGAGSFDILGGLEKTRPTIGQDPFLRSLYWEKKIFHSKEILAPTRQSPAIEAALQEGHPAPHLLVALGLLEISQGKRERGLQHLRRAAASPANQTRASEILEILGERREKPTPGSGP